MVHHPAARSKERHNGYVSRGGGSRGAPTSLRPEFAAPYRMVLTRKYIATPKQTRNAIADALERPRFLSATPAT
jgi:hypothetical protein